MNWYLAIAALLTILIGIAHSVLGERYIVGPLLRRGDLPRTKYGEGFTRGTIRGAWHLTTVIGFGVAAVLAHHAFSWGVNRSLPRMLAVMFAASAAVMGGWTRGRHFATYVFAVIAVLCWLGS